MRLFRWLLVLAIVAIVAAIGVTYQRGKRELAASATPKPVPLPAGLSGQAANWHWVETNEGRRKVEIWAKDFRQEKETNKLELDGVRLHIFHKDGTQYDRVESPHAVFRPGDQNLFSESEVTMTLGIPADDQPKRQLVSIKTSGVTFESKAGRVSTDRAAEFTFENGTGKAIGAWYDPATRELEMMRNVEILWKGHSPHAKPMRIETGSLVYKELASHIVLFPWSKLYRDNSVIEGADAIVTLKDGAIETVEAQKAKGVDRYPRRQLDYVADRMTVAFNDEGQAEKVTALGNARLESTSEATRTTLTSDRVDMEFAAANGESVLTRATGNGHSVVDSRPVAPGAGGKPDPAAIPDTRILHSEVIELAMRPGGHEIDTIVTHTPGRLEFLPNRPGGRQRTLNGERFWISYGERNLIRSFRAVTVATRTEPAKPKQPPVETWSQNLEADFDAKGQISRMRQWDNFRYVEGPRKATSASAVMEPQVDRIRLETKARVWDDTGSTSADAIDLYQASGDYAANGHVSSSRKPDAAPGKSAAGLGVFSGPEPVQAVAARMRSSERNSRIVYEGDAVLWQGANRVKGDRIEIDREAGRLVGQGRVETQLIEKAKAAAPAPATIFTTVKAPNLIYTDADRTAYYTGGAFLMRPNLRVRSLELRAVLAPSGANSDSSLERAIADGRVEIVQTSPGRVRNGRSEHADYFPADEKVILRGGQPVLEDSVQGNTKGEELTWFAADDRLLVNGVPNRPAISRLRKK